MKTSCGLFTNIAPLYSRAFWYQLASSENIEYFFYSSRFGFSGIKTIDPAESISVNEEGKLNWSFLKNIYFRGILFYQAGLISKSVSTKYDAYILNGEMHSTSNWIVAFICKIRKKPLLFWGHGLYGNERNIKKFLRITFLKMADYNLVYGDRSRKLMIDSGFDKEKVITVYNSLDFNTHSRLYEKKNLTELENLKRKLFPETSLLPVVLFIGRLTAEKKISYLIKSVSLSKIKGNSYNCLIVGAGNELNNLQNLSVSLGINDLVHFYGPSYDEGTNSRLIMLSDCCVSPGNVGLTAIHSLSFGTPVITHRNYFNQGPEVESVIQDQTGLLFKEDDVENLSDVIDDMIINKKKQIMENSCIEQVKKYWNPAKQAELFDRAVMDSIKNLKS